MKNINSIISGITTAVVCLVMSFSVFGQNKVDLNLATRVGENFIKMNDGIALSGETGSLQRVQTDKFPNLYIFNADGHGWIIVAGDKRMQPILGFSDESTFDPNDMAPAAEMIIGGYDYVVDSIVRYNARATDESVAQAWRSLERGYYEKNELIDPPFYPYPTQIEPLITTDWRQGNVSRWDNNFNKYCPMYDFVNPQWGINKRYKAVTGCTATAMAQWLYFHKRKPLESQFHIENGKKAFWGMFRNGGTYRVGLYDVYGTFKEGGGQGYFEFYDWNYSEGPTTELAAKIMYYCGLAGDAEYAIHHIGNDIGSPSLTGMPIEVAQQVLIDEFGLTRAYLKNRNSSEHWDDTLKKYLTNEMPLIYKGNSTMSHVYIIDGYKTDSDNNTLFHHNFCGAPPSGTNYCAYLSLDEYYPNNQAFLSISSMTDDYHNLYLVRIIDFGVSCTINTIYGTSYTVTKGNSTYVNNNGIVYAEPGDYRIYDVCQQGHIVIHVRVKKPNDCSPDVSDLNGSKKNYRDGSTTNHIIYESVTKYHEYVNAMSDFISNILGGAYWQDQEKGIEFWNLFQSLLDNNTGMIPEERISQLISQSQLDSISNDYIRIIAESYNHSVMNWNEGYYTNESLPEGTAGIIEYDTAAMRKAYEAQAYAESLGFSNVRQMYDNAYEMLESEIENQQTSVCARVTVQFTQKMTMTREAFNGTLQIFNGHESIPMQNILVDFRIKDAQGNDCTNLFQINTLSLDQITGISGDGSLAAQTNGTALVQFIPTKNAAPTEPKVYSFGGSFSFIDPFTGEGLTYPLYPVEITVNPSPDLYVDYFMQRNILGDDALTTDVVEPSVPAELGVIIHNQGAGEAKNVTLETAEPQIIDNEHGLAIDFAMYGTSFNGSPRQLGLMEIPFGNIGSGQTAVGEWLFTSSLLGHFVSYNAHVIHNSSYGNSDLSLVSHLDIHELIHPIYAYGSLDDGINDFLVNDNPDAYDTPDSIYFSHGGKTSVSVANGISFDHYVSASDTIVTLTVVPSRIGWNYGKTNDPGMNQYHIVSCIRNDDNQEIPLNNVWQTFVTIPDGGDPVYENKLHIVDTIPVLQTTTYTLVFAKSTSQNNSVSQATTLTEGWNWWSTFLDASSNQVFDMLKNALGSNASMIKSRADGFVTYMGDWYGTLQSINNQSMYMINMNTEQTISLAGTRANLATTPITINHGWNWIGFPSSVSVDINSALANTTPAESDLIKTRNAFATYYSSMGGWYGTLTSLTPGLGYMYQSNNEEPVEFVYSTITRNDIAPLDVQTTNHWEISVGEYSDNATLIGVIAINDEEQRDESLIVGAFVGDRCVGEARATYVEPFDRYLVFLTYFGNDSDEITFRLFDEDTNIETIGADNSLAFNANSMIGALESPFIINFTMTTGVDELAKQATLFPNPVKAMEKVHVGVKNVDATNMKMEIVNTLGMVIFQKTYHTSSIDITAPRLPGIYIVKITTGNGNVYYGKLIVE